MSDPNDDKKVDSPGSVPAEPSPVNPAPSTDNPTPAAEPLNTDTGVRFDQVIRNPEFQDYMERQIEKRVDAILASKTAPQVTKDEVAEIEKELDAKIAAGTLTAKDMVQAQRKIAEIAASVHFAPVKETVNTVSMQNAIAKFGKDNPDMWDLREDMLKILNSLPAASQVFWRNQPPEVAVEHLYLKAKVRRGNAAPAQNKDLGGSPPGRSAPKLGGGSLIDQALDARRKGDKVGYERIMREHNAVSQK